MSFFSKTRIRATELYQDAFYFLQEKYEQATEVFTPASPFGQILTVTANLGELIFYYIEATITELNIFRARNIESIYGMSRLTGHDPTRGISARGIIGLRPNTSASTRIEGNFIQIDRLSKVRVEDNSLDYFINFNSDFIRLQKNSREFINVEIIQGEINGVYSYWRYYRRGVIMNLTNPKVSIFFLAFLPQFADPVRGPVVVQLLQLGALFIGATILVFGSIALLAGTLGQWLQRSPRVQVVLNRLAGTVFIMLAIKLATSQR